MFAAAFSDEDQKIIQSIDQIWQSGYWEPVLKFTNDSRIISLVEIIRFKLYQARFNLKNILANDPKKLDLRNEKKSAELNAVIIHWELEALLFTLYRIMDLFAVFIALVYGIHTPRTGLGFRDFFPQATAYMNAQSFLAFNELKRKDPLLAEQLAAFYFSAENRMLSGFILKNGFRDSPFPYRYDSLSLNNENADIGKKQQRSQTAVYINSETIIKLEKAYRETTCKLGRLIFDHLKYEPILIHFFPGYQSGKDQAGIL